MAVHGDVCHYVYVCVLSAVQLHRRIFLWNEFGVRYNFIAVDYLVYTNEVIGNIFESYPVVPMIAALVAIAWWACGSWCGVRKSNSADCGI